MFAELEVAARSTRFIGTYNSNISMFMGMRIGLEHCLDFDEWLIW